VLRKVRESSGILAVLDCAIVSCACAAQHYTAATESDRHRQQPLESVQHWANLLDSVRICEVCGFYNIYENAMGIMAVYGQKSGFADLWQHHGSLSLLYKYAIIASIHATRASSTCRYCSLDYCFVWFEFAVRRTSLPVDNMFSIRYYTILNKYRV
jgi:hypothetical protein